ncbi:hypothetical protein HD806DRAFT_290928 [Xylariaceae sp. AK1471]|nr:hypothetical protein HD806DRAFT_290928 [Xylariaceae sp. AK1471]
MEVAGLVFGVLPVAVSAIDKYQEGLKAIGHYVNYPLTLKYIKRNLFIQIQQLRATMNDIGLEDPTLPQVRRRLRQLQPDCYEDFIDIIEHMDGVAMGLLDNLDIDIQGKPKWSNEASERVNWEWRKVKRSFGHQQCKEMFTDLQNLNNALKHCLILSNTRRSGSKALTTSNLLAHTIFQSKDEADRRSNVVNTSDLEVKGPTESCYSDSINRGSADDASSWVAEDEKRKRKSFFNKFRIFSRKKEEQENDEEGSKVASSNLSEEDRSEVTSPSLSDGGKQASTKTGHKGKPYLNALFAVSQRTQTLETSSFSSGLSNRNRQNQNTLGMCKRLNAAKPLGKSFRNSHAPSEAYSSDLEHARRDKRVKTNFRKKTMNFLRKNSDKKMPRPISAYESFEDSDFDNWSAWS